MVLHLAALPPELRALVATKCDAATAAQFALASLRWPAAHARCCYGSIWRSCWRPTGPSAKGCGGPPAAAGTGICTHYSEFACGECYGRQPVCNQFGCTRCADALVNGHLQMHVLRRRPHSALRPCFRQCAASSGFQNTLGFAPPPGLRS